MIKLQVIGNLGKDCIVNTVNGKNVINFTVAHTEKYRDSQGNNQERTTWVDCAYWTEKTGIAPYLKKGTQVYVEGTPDLRTYPKTDGSTGVSLTLRVFSVQLLGSRPNESGGVSGQESSYAGASNTNGISAGSSMGEPMDDLPF